MGAIFDSNNRPGCYLRIHGFWGVGNVRSLGWLVLWSALSIDTLSGLLSRSTRFSFAQLTLNFVVIRFVDFVTAIQNGGG